MISDSRPVSDETREKLVTVIIPCVNGLPIVAECVQCLLDQQSDAATEILVVDRTGDSTRNALRQRFPEVQVIETHALSSIPAMRALALTHSRGSIVAVIEDHCLTQPGWLQVIVRAFGQGHRAVGGPIENGAVDRVVDWAAFFCEYTRFMNPVPRGIVAEVAGNNCAYDRRLFENLKPELEQEAWESAWHARLRELGVEFYSDPDMAVWHKKSFGFRYFMNQRYHYSRSFAGMRLRGAALWKRGAYAIATGALPALLLFRMTRDVLRKRRSGKEFVLSLPLLVLFVMSWAFGETVGALFGPGRSLQMVD